MASTVACQKLITDYLSTHRALQLNTVLPYNWRPTPQEETFAPDSSEFDLPSPISPERPDFSPSAYTLRTPEFATQIKSEPEPDFDFGNFDDWMRWDSPNDTVLSPLTPTYFPSFDSLEDSTTTDMTGLEYQRGYENRGSIGTEDSGIFNDSASASEQPLFQTPSTMLSSPVVDPLAREGLYSTPLSWSQPEAGNRATQQQYGTILTPDEESKLRLIAMPCSPKYPTSTPSSPSHSDTSRSRKRKSIVEADEDEDESLESSHERHPVVKKAAHNMIEKRYRTNLNDKIAALRDSVPSLRAMCKENSRREENQDETQSTAPAHKMNKATVLSKATEYITALEKRNKNLAKENTSLKSRVDAFEILVMSRQPQNQGLDMAQWSLVGNGEGGR